MKENNNIKCLISNLKNSKAETCYYIAFVVTIISYGLLATLDDSKLYYATFLCVLGLMGITVLYGQYTKRDYIVAFLIVAYGFFLYRHMPYFLVFIYSMLLAGAKNVNFKKLCFINAISWSSILLIAMFLAYTGLIEQSQKPMTITNELGEQVKIYIDGLGWGHPNTTFALWFHCVLLYLYARFQKLKWFDFVITAILMTVLYKLLHCRTGYVTFLLVWGMIIYTKVVISRTTQTKKWMSIFLLVLPVCLIASWALPYIWANNQDSLNWINKLFTGRVNLSYQYLSNVPITWWGQSIEGAVGGYLDNMYLDHLLRQGLIVFIIMLIEMATILYFTWKCEHWEGLIMISAIMIYRIMEAMPFHEIAINPFLLLLGPVLFQYKGKKSAIY